MAASWVWSMAWLKRSRVLVQLRFEEVLPETFPPPPPREEFRLQRIFERKLIEEVEILTQ